MSLRGRLFTVCALFLALAGIFALRSSHAAVSSTLDAYVDDQGNIGLTYADGTPVGKAIPPGTYTIVVDDSTSFHDFHLYGPDFDNSTDVGLVQKVTWSATFQAGATYTFICDLHPDTMFGQFTATTNAAAVTGGSGGNGSSTAPATSGGVQSNGGPTQSSPAADPLRGALAAAVSAAGKLTLLQNGRPVKSLKSGRYRITVKDGSKQAGFVVASSGRSVTLTGTSFVGTHTVTVDLSRGRWSFFAAGAPKHPVFFTASA